MKSEKHKYLPTPQIDETLQRIYQQAAGRQVERKGAPSVKNYAKRIGWPEWRLYERAVELGLRRPKDPKWSEAENTILERNSHLSAYAIQKRLTANGFKRTQLAIATQIRRARLRTNESYYSERQLCLCLGLASCNPVSRWIRQGLLQARNRGTERTDQQGGDAKLIHESDIRQFILENPHLIDLRKVEQVWFFEIMFEGKAGMTVSQSLRKEQVKTLDEDDYGDDSSFDESLVRNLIDSAETEALNTHAV